MTLGQKISQMRRNLGRDWTQEKLAAEMRRHGADVNRAWVAQLETDRRVKPLLKTELAALAKIFKVAESVFAEERAPSGIAPTVYTTERVPVLGNVCAERFNFSFEAFPEEHLSIPQEPGRKLFALRISGDCMEPALRDGDFVIMDPAGVPNEGRIVLARIDGEYTLKRYFRTPTGIELRPDNKKYLPIKSSSNKLIIEAVAVHQHRRL